MRLGLMSALGLLALRLVGIADAVGDCVTGQAAIEIDQHTDLIGDGGGRRSRGGR
jgi:hypothetical protein